MCVHQKNRELQSLQSLFHYSIFLVALFLPFLQVDIARAQQCGTVFEAITTLTPPTFGFPAVWEARYQAPQEISTDDKDDKTAPADMAQTASGVITKNDTVFTFGRIISQKDFQSKSIVLAEINRRGRALKENIYPAKPAEEPVKLLPVGKSYIGVSNFKSGNEEHVRLSWYNHEGKYLKQKILNDNQFNYRAKTLSHAAEGSEKGFLLVLHAINRKDPTDQNGVLLRYTPSGERLWRRVYRPGIPNILENIKPFDEQYYLATGAIRLDDKRMAGWVMKLGYDGAVHWQRSYPRGDESNFLNADIIPLKNVEQNSFILSGYSVPSDNGAQASWIMSIDPLGEPLWQRFYRRPDYALSGNWVRKEDDGRIIFISNAKALAGKNGNDHIRILTLSARGNIIYDEAYKAGYETIATDFIDGWNKERILTANIQDDKNRVAESKIFAPINVVGLVENMADDNSDNEEKKFEPVHQGWVLVASALDAYKDPCDPKLSGY